MAAGRRQSSHVDWRLILEAHPRSPRQLFDGKEHFEIPAFQRPYVWNREEQWEPLWSDIVRVAESVVDALEAGEQPKVEHHFLGAVVYESKPPVTGDVVRHDVIDGQQRMTTLQLLIDAVQQVVAENGHDLMAEELESLVVNRGTAFRATRKRFKLWPSQADRGAFEFAMDGAGPWNGTSHRIIDAHTYFGEEAERWLRGDNDDDGVPPPGSEESRVEALVSTLEDRLIVVAIDLSGHDDAQLIFETLNDRGTPLLKADLIKNWLFRTGESVGSDVDAWAETQWAEFDSPWWRDEIRQGRLQRSRVDIFLQYWLTMRLADDLRAEHVFREFVNYVEPNMKTAEAADTVLRELRFDADTYRAFAQLDDSTPEGRFYRRVIETMELAATTPVFLWLLSTNHGVPAAQRQIALEALESWAIRRTLLRLTTKDVNKFMIYLLKELASSPPEEAGDVIVTRLSEQTSDSRYWPSDKDMFASLETSRLYGNVRQGRLRLVLGAVEQRLRQTSPMYESVTLPESLELEHIMPRGWRTHWDPQSALGPDDAARRDLLVNTIGNLTLITKSLNSSLSNRPWTDREANGLREGGEPDKGKRALLDRFSLLVMNKEIVSEHDHDWSEEDILRRTQHIVRAINATWPGPVAEIQDAAHLVAAHQTTVDDSESSAAWTADDVKRLSNEAGATLCIVLDALASTPEEGWSGDRFVASGLTRHAHSALGALTMKVRGSFNRSNVPVRYIEAGGVWQWSVTSEFAELWRAARLDPTINSAG